MPSIVYEVVAWMGREGRDITAEVLAPRTKSGCTFLTAWLERVVESAEPQGGTNSACAVQTLLTSLRLSLIACLPRVNPPCRNMRALRQSCVTTVALCAEATRMEWVVIDGVNLDPVTLCAVGADGDQLTPNKMSVKELRAELAARQCLLSGNKKELQKQLHNARAEAKGVQAIHDTLVADNSKRNSKAKSVSRHVLCALHLIAPAHR